MEHTIAFYFLWPSHCLAFSWTPFDATMIVWPPNRLSRSRNKFSRSVRLDQRAIMMPIWPSGFTANGKHLRWTAVWCTPDELLDSDEPKFGSTHGLPRKFGWKPMRFWNSQWNSYFRTLENLWSFKRSKKFMFLGKMKFSNFRTTNQACAFVVFTQLISRWWKWSRRLPNLMTCLCSEGFGLREGSFW